MASKAACLGRKVAILGAAGGIGQPLSLLLKASQYISELYLYDVVDSCGVGVDLSHIDTRCQVKSFTGCDVLPKAIQNAELVLIPAGMPRKPGMRRHDLIKNNADIIRDLMLAIAQCAPQAWVGIITNPINTTVPIAAGILKNAGVFEPCRLFGVTNLDTVRANTFAAELKCLDPQSIKIPVIGGHSSETMIPIFSCLKQSLTEEEIKCLTKDLQDAGTNVVTAKKGAGSATLSMAYSAARFTQSVCRAMNGEEDIVECSFVASCVTKAPFFANPLLLGCNGVEENLGLGQLSEFEESQIDNVVEKLLSEYQLAEDYLKENGLHDESSNN